MRTALEEALITLSGETKTVTANLAALTRQDYSEDVVVPLEFDDSMLDDMVCSAYKSVDAGEFNIDPDFWERGDCCHSQIE